MNSAKRMWSVTAIVLAILFIGCSAVLSKRSLLTLKGQGQGSTSVREAVKTPASEREALMQIATAQTRHFKGDPDAPVTILEFSDFQ